MNAREMLDALETARQLLAERDAEIAALREALEWILHLHHGVSMDGSRDVSDTEWRAALEAGITALSAQTDGGKS